MGKPITVTKCDDCPLFFDDVICGHPEVGENMNVCWSDDFERKVGGSGLPPECPLRRDRSLTIVLDEKIWYADCRDFTQYDLDTMPGELWNDMTLKERAKWKSYWAQKGDSAFCCLSCGYSVPFPGGPCGACNLRSKKERG